MKHLSVTLILLASVAPAVFAGQSIDETLPANANPAIDITVYKGDVRIRSWDQDAVRINGTLGDDAENYSFGRTVTALTFSENIPDEFWQRSCLFGGRCNDNDREGGAVLEIFVPRRATLRINGMHVDADVAALEGNISVQLGRGNIQAQGLSGLIRLQTGVGNINSTALRGKAALQTTAGTIQDDGSSGERMSYRTLNGGIQVNSNAARISANTASGPITLNLGLATEIDASSVNSGITATFTPNHDALVDLVTTNGNVALKLPQTLSTQMELATTKGGEIKHSFPVAAAATESESDGNSERFTLGAGEGVVRVSTVTGNISLKNLD